MLTLTTPEGITVTAPTDVQLASAWGDRIHGPAWDVDLSPFDQHTIMHELLDEVHEIEAGEHPGYTVTTT